MSEGTFEISAETNMVDYDDYEERSGFIFNDTSRMQEVSFVFSTMNFTDIGVDANPFQFTVFVKSEALADIETVKDAIFYDLYTFWMAFFLLSSILYLVIFALVMNYIAASITEPFLELSWRILLNVKSIHKMKRKVRKDERLGRPSSNSAI